MANLLVRERVAACVSISNVNSIFDWKGKTESQDERLLIVKSLKSRFSDIEKLVKANHSYECPEIIACDISSASKEYERWVRQTCGKPKSGERKEN